jgi:pimeloyl-ACP methyl ester carboxylesterase
MTATTTSVWMTARLARGSTTGDHWSRQDRPAITLSTARPDHPQCPARRQALQWTQVSDFKLNIGTVTPLSDAHFSADRVSAVWQPLAFVKDGGAGIHFLEPRPNRELVLFVHGIEGTPRNFMFDRTPRSPAVSAVVVSYPSGLRLPELAQGMYRLFADLQYRYRFKRLHVVAHSMGGLVARGFINECARRNDCDSIASFITISTPWGGHSAAAAGVKHAPTVVPAWIDMAPGSGYLATLFATPLSASLRYDLLFSFKRTDNVGEQNDDGTVTLMSQLREEAQQQARSTHGYDETHMSVLESALVAERVNIILRSH